MTTKTTKAKVTLAEREDVAREYGFDGVLAIVDHETHGRLLIADGYGGEGQPRGGCVRWEHGGVWQLKSNDTLQSLRNGEWNDCATLLDAVCHGEDRSRPVLDFSGNAIANVAKAAGL